MRGGSAPSKRDSKMSGHAGNYKKRYVNHLGSRSKLTCLIHGNASQPSKHCKLLNYFGTRYAEGIPFKDSRNNPNINMFFRKQEVNAMVQHAVCDIL